MLHIKTTTNGISRYTDLKSIQELEKYGVDSVMMSWALYGNNSHARLYSANRKRSILRWNCQK